MQGMRGAATGHCFHQSRARFINLILTDLKTKTLVKLVSCHPGASYYFSLIPTAWHRPYAIVWLYHNVHRPITGYEMEQQSSGTSWVQDLRKLGE